MKNSCRFRMSSPSIIIFLLLIPEGGSVRIIGGHTVAPHSRPYMAMVQISQNKVCSGSLIAKDWVLTAAHCVLNNTSVVILGAHSLSKNESEKQIMAIKKDFAYPHFDQNAITGDLKLLKLKKKATINKNVAILPLPKKGDDVKPETKCQVAGWGKYNNNSSLSDTLREVNVTIIDRKVCNDPKHYDSDPVIGPDLICAGDLQGGKDSCDGDSGSPLLCEGVFRGVSSFGLTGNCGDPSGPGVYTLLSNKYLKWIKTTMRQKV